MYKLKPFQFQVLKKNINPCDQLLERSGYCVVSNDAYLLLYGGFKPHGHTGLNLYGPPTSSLLRELWKYSFDLGEWRIIACQNVPQELTSSRVILSGNIILIYGGTGVPFGAFCSNRMYLGNLANEFTEDGMKFEKLEVTGDVPMPLYGQGVAMHGKYIYSLSGTSGYEYEMDVHQLDLSTKKWELLYKSCGEYLEPEPRYHHEVIFYKSKIYVFDGGRGGPSDICYGFQTILTFDVITKKWQFEPAKPDGRLPILCYPFNRSFHRCIQCPENPNLVYLCGGSNEMRDFRDVWRFDIDNLQWENLPNCVMPWPVYFHSTTVTPSGRMCIYGGIVATNYNDGSGRSNDIVSAWITIPKLKVIAWEAMIYYFKDQMFASTDDDLKKNGLPKEYYDRIIKERRVHKISTLKNN